MSDLLVQRLKAVKRELTALKTAHRRGLGLLKVYRREETFTPPGGQGTYNGIKITISFSRNFAKSPLVSLSGLTMGSMTVQSLYVNSVKYIDDFSLEIIADLVWTSVIPNKFVIISSAPVEEVNYVWG